jgi:hypothetical protein
MLFNGSAAAELFAASANGGRVLFTRNVASIVMDLDDVERIDLNALGGTDTTTVKDLSGTDVSEIDVDLAGVLGGTAGDGQADAVVVNGTNGDEVAVVAGDASGVSVNGLAAQVNIARAEAANDRLSVNLQAGDDVLSGGPGDDVLIGGPGLDVIDGGPGDDIEIQLLGSDNVTSAKSVDREWLASHIRVVKGKTVLDLGGETHTLPHADLSRLIGDVPTP